MLRDSSSIAAKVIEDLSARYPITEKAEQKAR